MKLSLNHIRYYADKHKWAGDPAPHGVHELVKAIGAKLGAVEEVTSFGTKYAGIVVAKIVSCQKHPNADKLNICLIDDGTKTPDVDRTPEGLVQVVCGAPNAREGIYVAWLPPGTVVPSTADKDPFRLDARDIRGQKSNGMLASAKELAISDDHGGILEIPEGLAPGTDFAEAFELKDDAIIDIENKMFTHRPDCFGMMGVAREIAGIQGQQFTSPEWYTSKPQFPGAQGKTLPLQVDNQLSELVPRFTAVAMQNVKVGPSPLWLQISLTRLGAKPINNIVDLTNYYMLLTGQPLHAYDYDKVAQRSGAGRPVIAVRHPKEGEKVSLLNGKTITPRPEAIMIATDKELIGVGGIMGGSDTEVDESTTRIILEAATFDMYSVRRTSMAHGLFTDASTRFTKGQSPLQLLAVSARTLTDITALSGGMQASEVIDVHTLPPDVLQRGSLYPAVTVSKDFVNARLGLELSADDMAQLLKNVEFGVKVASDELFVTAPFWRTDIEIPEDLVEEIGRLYGYDHLPIGLPKRSIRPAEQNSLLELKATLRQALAAAGANEVLTYSFVHGNLLDKVGQGRDQAFEVSNALSPDLQYFRIGLTPSLLEKVHPNIKAGYDQFALFEMNKVHTASQADNGEGVPKEFENLACVFASKQPGSGAPYYQARVYMDHIAHALGIDVVYEPVTQPPDFAVAAPFEPSRSARVKLRGSGVVLGLIGEYKASVRRALKLPDHVAGFEINIGTDALTQSKPSYKALSRYPSVQQDISFRVPATLMYHQLYEFVSSQLPKAADMLVDISPLDIYQKEGAKHITLRVRVTSYVKTLTDTEVNNLLDAIAEASARDLQATRI